MAVTVVEAITTVPCTIIEVQFPREVPFSIFFAETAALLTVMLRYANEETAPLIAKDWLQRSNVRFTLNIASNPLLLAVEVNVLLKKVRKSTKKESTKCHTQHQRKLSSWLWLVCSTDWCSVARELKCPCS